MRTPVHACPRLHSPTPRRAPPVCQWRRCASHPSGVATHRVFHTFFFPSLDAATGWQTARVSHGLARNHERSLPLQSPAVCVLWPPCLGTCASRLVHHCTYIRSSWRLDGAAGLATADRILKGAQRCWAVFAMRSSQFTPVFSEACKRLGLDASRPRHDEKSLILPGSSRIATFRRHSPALLVCS